MWYKDEIKNEEKILFVVRGGSGSGKSFLAKQLAGDTGKIFSADEYFMKDGKYQFDPKLLGKAHGWCYYRCVDAMNKGISPIVFDNTNTEAWEPKRIVQDAIQRGYKVEVREPDTSWKFNAEELFKRNTHNVPLETIHKQLNRWHPDLTVEDILNSKSPFDKKEKG
jgi:NEDD4-binding protein 2